MRMNPTAGQARKSISMKQSLDLRLGQHLTITPQLQQAIRLLQLSAIELQQEVQEALESNPLLEEAEDESADVKIEGGNDTVETESAADTTDNDNAEPTDLDMEQASLADASDTEWDDTFEAAAPTARQDGEGRSDIDARNSRPQTLRDHLLWQMQMTQFSATDLRIAEAVIDAVNEDGYLTSTVEEIRQILSAATPPANGTAPPTIELDEIAAVLRQIQNFDPIGVAARDLTECLQLQLRALDPGTPFRDEAMQLATPEYLAMLGQHDFNQLRRELKLATETLSGAVLLIQNLNPRPGDAVQAATATYIAPDVIVRKIRGVWRADLNGEVAPRLQINQAYERLIQRGNGSRDNRYLQDQLQQARWLIKSLSSRNETLLKVARTIVDRQRAFFDHGPEAMKPLVLHDIAKTVEMHESTISRVTTNKYMLTPRGIFELKYFFSSHVGTADGGTCSATAIRSLIKKLIEAESSLKPISDSRIAEILAAQGINVARRTIAKYRESLSIPPSNQRKSIL